MALLPDDLDRLTNQQVGEDLIDLPLSEGDVEANDGIGAVDVELSHVGPGTIDLDLRRGRSWREIAARPAARYLNAKLRFELLATLSEIDAGRDQDRRSEKNGKSNTHG